VTDFVWTDELNDATVRDELDRRHPERTKLRAKDVGGLRQAFDVVEDIWAPTIERARRLPSAKLHERVNGEYSFIETLRHLLFAWDAWLPRMVLRVPDGYHDWAVPPDLPADAGSGVMWSIAAGWSSSSDAAPGLDPVLNVRAERLAHVREWLSGATPEDLKSLVSPPPWYPQRECPVLFCFRVVLNEEWWHQQYAIRDLTVLERA
jgi:DinB family protein